MRNCIKGETKIKNILVTYTDLENKKNDEIYKIKN